MPARWNVLDALGDEDERLIVARRPIQRVLIDKAFDVKLAQDELLAAAVVAEQPPILVNLAFRVLLLRRIGGVDVKIMISVIHSDNLLARYNSTRLHGRLLEAGVEIYEYNRTMLHHKIMVCDGLWSTAGTTNFDDRSFAHNEENNICVHDRAFAAEWERIFLDDLQGCDQIRLHDWRNRGLMMKSTELFMVQIAGVTSLYFLFVGSHDIAD